MNKVALARKGQLAVINFCELNNLPVPMFREQPAETWRLGGCGYYRPNRGIVICVPKCAEPGYVGRQWSWPGYSTDRTPYGVYAHELGHHIEHLFGSHYSNGVGMFAKGVQITSGESAITSYCPNASEWFAELFRVFVTNPDLLSKLRPKTFNLLHNRMKIVEQRSWEQVLAEAPERYLTAARNKMK